MNPEMIDFGIKLKKEGEIFYKENAEKCRDPHARDLLLILAYEENRHYQLLKTFKEGLYGLMYTPFIKKVINVFEKMRETKQFFTNKTFLVQSLEKALEIEEKYISFYTEQVNKTHDSKIKNFFIKLKQEEESHYSLIKSWIEFFDHPDHWLARAEFIKINEY